MDTPNFEKLISLCRCSVQISVNEHKDYNDSVLTYLRGYGKNVNKSKEIDKRVIQEMIRKNRIVKLKFYPLAGSSFILLFHYDLKLIIEQGLKIMEKQYSSYQKI